MAVLTPKQKRFCLKYVETVDVQQASDHADLNVQTGRKMLKRPHIANAIQALFDKRAERCEITADQVLQRCADMAFFDIREIINDDGTIRPVDEWPETAAAAVTGMTVREHYNKDGEMTGITHTLKTVSREKAIELLGKHLKLFNDTVEVTGNDELIAALQEGRNRVSERKSEATVH